MTMLRATKIRIYPTPEQAALRITVKEIGE
ncbi:hypothetical protein CPJ79_23365 [Salmonella enterica]|nr:hypothetical protein [Salmonella enterica]EBE5132218.1 hypothetical protein [Salmonella enterica]EBT6816524.1 hypothetical protein [Salmonella enterica]